VLHQFSGMIPDEEVRVTRHRRCPFAAPQPDRAQGVKAAQRRAPGTGSLDAEHDQDAGEEKDTGCFTATP
jgi:hypothetical protein